MSLNLNLSLSKAEKKRRKERKVYWITVKHHEFLMMESSPHRSSPSTRSESLSPQLENSPPSPSLKSSSPISSLLLASPASSRVTDEQPSSPLNEGLDVYSSPLRGSSPISSTGSVSPPSSPIQFKANEMRRPYTFHEDEVPRKRKYWPPSPNSKDLSHASVSNVNPSMVPFEDTINTSFSHVPQNIPESSEETYPDFNVSYDGQNSDNAGSVRSVDSSSAVSSLISAFSEDVSRDVLSDCDVSSVESSIKSSTVSSDSEDGDSSEDEGVNFFVGNVGVFDNHSFTVNEGVVMLLELFLKHKLEKTTLVDIFQSVLKFLPPNHNFPKSKHMLFKYIHNLCPPVKAIVHFYCGNCLYYLGEDCKECPICFSNDSKKFFQLPLIEQVKNLFENHDLANIIDKYAEERAARGIHYDYLDIIDGSEYKRAHIPGQYNLTFLAHTDGISVSESSKVSLWPLEYVICEAPPHLRNKLVIVAGVWLDSCKPNMNCFLSPFAEELNSIRRQGVSWVHPETKQHKTTYIAVPGFCADAPARSELQNILTHGGRYCCNLCEQKMVKLPSEADPAPGNKPRKRVFDFHETPCTLRTAERMDAHGRVSEENFRQTGKMDKPRKGVKGMSIVSMFPNCDRSTVVYPEYMHILLGIIKQFMHLWFETDGRWSLRKHQTEINLFLENLRVPDFVTRIPRSTDCYKSWKANENRSFLLYFSLVALSPYMENEYLQHWMLLVNGIFLLLQDVVTAKDVSKAEIMIRLFLRDFSGLYRPSSFSYNLHNLEHFCLMVRRWGPLWCNSAFSFESFNGSLAKNIHGSKHQGQELVNTIELSQAVQVLKALNIKKANEETMLHNGLLSKIPNFQLNKAQVQILKDSQLVCESAYYRASVERQVLTCTVYHRQHKRNNFTICFRDKEGLKRYGEVNYFLLCSREGNIEQKMMLVNCFKIQHLRMFTHTQSKAVTKHIIPIVESCEILLLPLENFMFKVIRVGGFVCERPNTFEVNL